MLGTALMTAQQVLKKLRGRVVAGKKGVAPGCVFMVQQHEHVLMVQQNRVLIGRQVGKGFQDMPGQIGVRV